jgi:uncharacterized protein (PEP-CTERM system associated)
MNPIFLPSPQLLRQGAVWTVTGLVVLTCTGAHAQNTVQAATPFMTIVPRVSVTETITDNANLSNANRQSEQITDVSPGIRLTLNGARIKTYFDYSLHEIAYAKNTASRQSQNELNTFGTIEAVDNWAFVDFSGNISQQTVSAFGLQSLNNSAVSANRTEVSSYRLAPYIRGQLGQVAEYEARISRSVTGSDGQNLSGVATIESTINLSSGNSSRSLGWTADLGRQSVAYSAGRFTEVDNVNLGLVYNVNPHVEVFAKAGHEANNYTSQDKQGNPTNSIGVKWVPSELSSVNFTRNHRSFGEAYNLIVQHRSARTVWKFSDTKDVSATPSQFGVVSVGSMYDLLFSQFASIEPDPVARAKMVENYLQTNGISASSNVNNSFLTTAVSLQRRQELSFALLGVRDTITFIASRTESSRLDTISLGVDDLADTSSVSQLGLSVQYAHRLTPDYSLGVLYSQQKTSGSTNLQDTSLRSLNLNVSGKVGKRTSVSLGARRTVVDSATSPYSENAVTGNLNVQF